ncbi:MAG: SDR family oxidoreductase [Oscillospiraceae bacterium]|nr:SDR family oxidoreductase [Oscillospiraceae bacterium]
MENNNNSSDGRKCAFVTGGSRHIGQGIAVVLAEYGYDVAITYAASFDGAKETQRQIEALGRRCFIYEAHLEQPDAPEKAVNQARRDLGRLDVMVCNAGKDVRSSVLTVTAEDLDYLYVNNLRNYLLCAGAAARHMVNDKIEGSIIMITSVRGQLAHPDDFYYGGIKAAMDRACKSMALDLSAYNIRVNCIAPGAVWKPDKDGNYPETPFLRESIPLHRSGHIRDIGEAAAFLAGERSAYITGTTLLVDGGLSLPGLLEHHEAIPWDSSQRKPKTYEKAMKMLKKSQEE